MDQHLVDRDHEQDHVQRHVRGHDEHREADGLAKAPEEHEAEQGQEHEGDRDRMVEAMRHERVLDDVGGGVGRGQRDGDDEVGEGEAEEQQDHELAPPARQEALEHLDGALAVGALRRHERVDRIGHEEGHEDEEEGGHGGQGSRRQGRDARLVAEGREVVDPREAHDLPPGVLNVVRALAHDRALEEPAAQGISIRARLGRRPRGRGVFLQLGFANGERAAAHGSPFSSPAPGGSRRPRPITVVAAGTSAAVKGRPAGRKRTTSQARRPAMT